MRMTGVWAALGAGVVICVLGTACRHGTGSTSWKAPGFGKAPGRELAQYRSQLNLNVDLIPKGLYGRKYDRPMRPTYITVHSTQTYSSNANAAFWARGMKSGKFTATHNLLGYLTWHFSVDQSSVWQSLPLSERGEHADYEGMGNKRSIGIEMCENRGNSRAATVERTARLCAVLMKEYGIPVSRVVPHYHWEQIRPRTGKNLGHKDCPKFLLDNGVPGPKWAAFQRKVQGYRDRI